LILRGTIGRHNYCYCGTQVELSSSAVFAGFCFPLFAGSKAYTTYCNSYYARVPYGYFIRTGGYIGSTGPYIIGLYAQRARIKQLRDVAATTATTAGTYID
jgi:hypothetical protein